MQFFLTVIIYLLTGYTDTEESRVTEGARFWLEADIIVCLRVQHHSNATYVFLVVREKHQDTATEKKKQFQIFFSFFLSI